MSLTFQVTHQDKASAARCGRLTLKRGVIETPVFMPVGTAGTVKALDSDELAALGATIILANTYHLMMRPGEDTVRELGGLHRFMNWPHPILTDSGGYQVYSLAKLRKLTEAGVTFQSHIDGTSHFLSPERALEIQQAIDSDIWMVLDECTPYPATLNEARTSMELTLQWAERSVCHFQKMETKSSLFPIVQGGMHEVLRRECVARLRDLDNKCFQGWAIGGLSVTEPTELTFQMVEATVLELPPEPPRYLMGMGLPTDIVEAVTRGIDMFDCVIPTRNARNGQLFTSQGALQIRHACHAKDPRPIDENCACMTCQKYSRAYLRHLYLAKEILSARLNTIHNIFYYLQLMKAIRQAIHEGRFQQWKKEFYENTLSSPDHELHGSAEPPPVRPIARPCRG